VNYRKLLRGRPLDLLS